MILPEVIKNLSFTLLIFKSEDSKQVVSIIKSVPLVDIKWRKENQQNSDNWKSAIKTIRRDNSIQIKCIRHLWTKRVDLQKHRVILSRRRKWWYVFTFNSPPTFLYPSVANSTTSLASQPIKICPVRCLRCNTALCNITLCLRRYCWWNVDAGSPTYSKLTTVMWLL
jgi:hypothetical protein